MFRGWLVSARAEECDAITGALVVAMASKNSLVGNVRNIHHHSHPVHFEHDLFAEIGEPVVMRDLGIVDVSG